MGLRARACHQSRFSSAFLRQTACILILVAAASCQRQPPPAPSAERLAEIEEANEPKDFVESIAVAPDGSLVATGERRGRISVWDLGVAAPPVVFGGPSKQAVIDLAFSPDGSLLASLGRYGDGTVRL